MNKYEFIALLIFVAVCVAAIFFAKWYFDAVLASDYPNWVKYLLLRR
jgi:hypothetical protein